MYMYIALLFQSGPWVPGGAPPPSSGYGMPPPPGGTPGYPTPPSMPTSGTVL